MLNWFRKSFAKRVQLPQETAAQDHADKAVTQPEAPNESAVLKRRGDEHLKGGAVDEAVQHYQQALKIDPKFADAHNMLGDAFREQGKLAEAARCYRAALEHAPNLANAHYGLGVTLLERSDALNATVYFRKALALEPDFAKAHNALGFALMETGKSSEALACFQKTLSFEPENGMALHLIASLTGSNPEHPPSQYIEKLFDGFANTFDTHLQTLKYDTPKNLLMLITQITAPTTGKWNVLDLGCGTGLVGLEIAPYAKQLVGVDLSAKMLEKAKGRNLYHRLEKADLVTMMKNETASSYDLVIAADSLIYLGKLDDVAKETKRLLRPSGLFAFSVEALETLPNLEPNQRVQLDYQLQTSPSCRYAHSSQYLSKLAADNDFKTPRIKMERTRLSCGNPVNGYLVLLENH